MKDEILENYEYSIGYVSKFTKLPQSVLRYWETVIDIFTPYKSPGGTRRYSDADIELVLRLKKLLYDQKLTIAGANKILNNPVSVADEETITLPKQQFKELIQEFEEIIKSIRSSKQ